MVLISPSQLCSLWIGKGLSYIERLSFVSMLHQGHPVALYIYSPVENVPDGVEIRDANTILPEEAIIYDHQTRSPALFTNHFRYELQRHNAGTWVDADLVLLAPLPERDYLFGWESEKRINGAVFKAPADSELLRYLLEFTQASPVIPPWWPEWKKRLQGLRAFLGWPIKHQDMPWGTFGPGAITYFVHECGLASDVLPKNVFYPIHHNNADWFFDPRVNINRYLGEDTIAVHLWNKLITQYKDAPAPKGSFIQEQCHRLGIDMT